VKSWDSSVSIAATLRARRSGFDSRQRNQTNSEAHPASFPMGTEALSPGLKRPGREADHTLPISAEVTICTELYLHSSIRLYGVVLS
jgi:hypothetical protein